MATTLNPARPFPGAGVYPLDSGHFDEAFAQTGTSRPPYAMVVDALARQNLVELRERVRSNVEEIGLSFGPGSADDRRPGAAGDRRGRVGGARGGAAAAGAGAERLRPRRLRGPADLRGGRRPAAAAGDLPGIRAADAGTARPGGAARHGRGHGPDPRRRRRAAGAGGQPADALRGDLRDRGAGSGRPGARRRGGEGRAPTGRLRRTAGRGDPRRGALPARRRTGRRDPLRRPRERRLLRARAARPRTRRCRSSRRTSSPRRAGACTPASAASACSSTSSTAASTRTASPTRGGALTPLGALLAPALESGRLRCVNAIGTGLADDKLAHAYVADMVRFYLGEEPRLRSVPSYDLSDPEAPRRGRRPPRRAGGEAARRLRRPRRDDHAARHRGRAPQGDRPGAAPPGALRRPGAGAALHPPDRGRRRPRAAPRRPAPLRPQPGRAASPR